MSESKQKKLSPNRIKKSPDKRRDSAMDNEMESELEDLTEIKPRIHRRQVVQEFENQVP